MNDVDLLVKAVQADPYNPIPAAMLTDELMSAKDMLRTEADRHVLNVQLTEISRRNLETVELIWCSQGAPQQHLVKLLRDNWPELAPEGTAIYFCDHDQPPFFANPPVPVGSLVAGDAVYVGAVWVLMNTPKTLIDYARLMRDQRAKFIERGLRAKKRSRRK